MAGGFGSISTKFVDPDRLGRPRRSLLVRPRGWSLDEAADVARFDSADLELIARGGATIDWPHLVGGWPDATERALLPWAVVHQALRAAHTLHLHADGLCTIADSPEGGTLCAELFGERARWAPFMAPGPELARALVDDGPACVLVKGVGVIAWGDAPEELEERVATMDAEAAGWLASRRTVTETTDPHEGVAGDIERLLVTTRGRVSKPRRMVLYLDTTLRSISDRAEAEPIARATPDSDLITPGMLDGAELVPGVGLIAAGRDEAEARSIGAAAAHAHRVTAALIDGFGGIGALPHRVATGSAGVARDDGGPARGRVYVVTGAASGIGRDIARHLAGQGAQLGLGDLNAAALDLVADELEPLAGRPVVVAGDLTDENVVDLLVRSTVLRFGGIDGAVLNAGVAIPGEVRSLSAVDWRRSLDVNATSHFLLAKRLLPVLEAQMLGGSLVFIGSKNMFSPGAGFGAYSASKAALAQLARVIAIEAGPLGVRSNIVNPDNVFEGSALWSPELRAQRAAVYGVRPEDLEAYYRQRNLMKVSITGRDVAKAVAFLLSDDAERTTACVLTVDGGVPGVFPR